MICAPAVSVRAMGICGILAAVELLGCNDTTRPLTMTITAVSPDSGSSAGGTSVTITGTNFVNVTNVSIGGAELGNRTVVISTQITGTTPGATDLGAADVVVTSSSHGGVACTGCFDYFVAIVASPLAAGVFHSCALTSVGAAYCWGRNGEGRLGDGSTVEKHTPAPVSGALSFAALAADGGYTCGLTDVGAAYCWGANQHGQLGDGSTTTSSVPVAVSGGLNFVAVDAGGMPAIKSVGFGHTCGLTAAGMAYCWGANNRGQLGDGSTTNSVAPQAVSGGLRFTTIVVGPVIKSATK